MANNKQIGIPEIDCLLAKWALDARYAHRNERDPACGDMFHADRLAHNKCSRELRRAMKDWAVRVTAKA